MRYKTRKHRFNPRKSIRGGFNSFMKWLTGSQIKKNKTLSIKSGSNSNSNSNSNSSRNTIIRFHSTQCGHCIELNQIWPTIVKQKSSAFKFIDVNQNDFNNGKLEELNKRYNVQMQVDGYPTVYKIINGNATDYNGNRDVKSFLKWMS